MKRGAMGWITGGVWGCKVVITRVLFQMSVVSPEGHREHRGDTESTEKKQKAQRSHREHREDTENTEKKQIPLLRALCVSSANSV
jgi:hypothetical protein